MTFFEGSEKKIEMVVDGVNLRKLGRSYWEDIVKKCGAEILSQISNDHLDAYLLSESSLFVWDNRMLMITCGQTVLLRSILALIKDLGEQRICCLIFQRKNEYDQSQQVSSFIDDAKVLRELIGGQGLRFGHLDGHHHFVFNSDRPYHPSRGDVTWELLMYHIEGEEGRILRSDPPEKAKTKELLKVQLLQDFIVDDYWFSPCGHSMNAIKGDRYVTTHVTPQEQYSYVSYETNWGIGGESLLPQLVQSLRPDSFDLITFDGSGDFNFGNDYLKWDHVKKDLSCGYHTQFFHYVSVCCEPRDPYPLINEES